MGRTDTLTEAQRLALDVRWWVYANRAPAIKKAVQMAFLKHWSRRVAALLRRNQEGPSRGRPRTWKELAAALDRDPGNVARQKHQYLPDTLLRLSYFTALGVGAGDLEPSPEEWVTAASCYLVALHDPTAPLSAVDAQAYTAYVLANPGRHRDGFDPRCLAEAVRRLGPPADAIEKAVRRAAGALGVILQVQFVEMVDATPRP